MAQELSHLGQLLGNLPALRGMKRLHLGKIRQILPCTLQIQLPCWKDQYELAIGILGLIGPGSTKGMRQPNVEMIFGQLKLEFWFDEVFG